MERKGLILFTILVCTSFFANAEAMKQLFPHRKIEIVHREKCGEQSLFPHLYEADHETESPELTEPESPEPAQSSEPTEPMELAESSEQSESSEPAESPEPAESSEPTEPTELAESSEPTDSPEPTEPTELAESPEPAESSEPAESAEFDEADFINNQIDPIHRADPEERELATKPIESFSEVEPVYEIFETKSNFNFIQLDTVTGQMYIIHLIEFGMRKEENRKEFLLNEKNLAAGKKPIPGRFTLYPTFNMWTFILLDQIDGGTWQVQWSEKGRDRFIEPIFFLAVPDATL
ncbi:MAG: hypothetical protein IIW10_06875 [Spirochaetaceae bacterium]|nr:hypothetical protein [Spirochaetaceae bacterium]